MLHTAAEGGTATESNKEGGRVLGRVTRGAGRGRKEGRGKGGGGRNLGTDSVSWVPYPKLIPE